MPEIRFDLRNSFSGMAYHQLWLIRFNLVLLVENEDEFLRNTVPHEVAHLIAPKVNPVPPGKKRLLPHGKEWVEVMRVFGAPPYRTHQYLWRHHEI